MTIRWDPARGDGALRYALAEPREAVYVLPRRFACKVLGIHSRALCAGRHDEAHEIWRLELRAGVARRDPWWDRVHPVDALQMAYARTRDAIPWPGSVDRLISDVRERRRAREGGPSWSALRRIPLEGYGCCAVCAARWRAGRGIRHAKCGQAMSKALEWYNADRAAEHARQRGGAAPSNP